MGRRKNGVEHAPKKSGPNVESHKKRPRASRSSPAEKAPDISTAEGLARLASGLGLQLKALASDFHEANARTAQLEVNDTAAQVLDATTTILAGVSVARELADLPELAGWAKSCSEFLKSKGARGPTRHDPRLSRHEGMRAILGILTRLLEEKKSPQPSGARPHRRPVDHTATAGKILEDVTSYLQAFPEVRTNIPLTFSDENKERANLLFKAEIGPDRRATNTPLEFRLLKVFLRSHKYEGDVDDDTDFIRHELKKRSTRATGQPARTKAAISRGRSSSPTPTGKLPDVPVRGGRKK